MKLSKYTFLLETEHGYTVYNSLSNSLLNIDKESYDYLTEVKQQKKSVEPEFLDEELYTVLEEKRFITENFKDEFLLYKSIISNIRETNNSMHLTIGPTMDCNYSCPYCFENREKGFITEEVMDSIIKYIGALDKLENINLTWFGGEPLMAAEQIRQFYRKFRPTWKKSFSSNIITNGFLIDPSTIEILKEAEVSSIQITLDGNKDSHNKMKFTDDCEDTFTRTLENIDMVTDMAPDIFVSIRVNLTKQNIGEFVGLFHLLSTRYKGRNVSISPAPVNNRGVKEFGKNDGYFLTREEIVEFILKLYKKNGIYTHYLDYPKMFFSECAIRGKIAITVDPKGYIYKCWEIIGNKKYAIGKFEDGKIVNVNHTILNRQLYGGDTLDGKKCSACGYLPVCNGGCPIQRIENEFDGCKNDTCCIYKGFLPEFMGIHLGLKKTGFKNQ